jgi:ribosome-associated protein
MADTAKNNEDIARLMGQLLAEHKAQDVSVLDLRGICDWTDFFVVATTTSTGHRQGLHRHLIDCAAENKIELKNKKKVIDDEDEWLLLDLGFLVVHIFSPTAREFYDLDKLWYQAKRITPA